MIRGDRQQSTPAKDPTMRLIGYLWASPVTVIGLALALLALLTGGSVHLRAGVIEVAGGLAGRLLRGNRLWHGGAAMTLGHVVFARDAECLERSRPHEEQHVRQFERWGPLLLPVYWMVGVWLWCRGRDPYLDHPLEPPAG
jgi:hypothetical protein